MEKINFKIYPYYKGNTDCSKSTPYEDDWQLDENGIPFIAGQINVDEMIQSFASECDINNIIAQHVANGTLDELCVVPQDDSLVDISSIPSDINTQNSMASEISRVYSSLTPEQKSLFTGYDDFVLNFNKLFTKNDDIKENTNES